MRMLEIKEKSGWNFPWGVVFVCLGVASLLTACSENTSSGGCDTNDECLRFTVCQEGACEEVECSTDTDCGEGEQCVPTPEGKLVCTPTECGPEEPCVQANHQCVDGLCVDNGANGNCKIDGQDCLFSGECCEGMVCESNICVAQDPCTSDEDCVPGICDLKTGICTEGKGCVVDGCDPGLVCDETTGECNPGGESDLCSACTNDTDCAGAFCTALGGNTYCVPECTTNNDCSTGYKCFNVQGAGLRCVPGSYTCEQPCIQDGCPDGKTCDFASGLCIPQLALCDNCEKDDQCGIGARCVLVGTQGKRCIPQCVNEACATGGSCQLYEGVDICHPGAECCFGEGCDNAEAGEETGDESGGGDNCNRPCTPPFPICNPQNNTCVECLINEDCPADQFCEVSTKLCTSDVCAACVDPYPACTTINGQPACVQCIVDADCPSGDCDEATFFCLGAPPGVVSDSCKCSSDADCPAGTQFSLKCNTSLGTCYDTGGACDNISACCDALSGSECVSVLELFGGGGGLPAGGLPGGLPTGGAFGLCTCSSELAEFACLLDPSQCGDTAGDCMPGLSCSPFGLLLGLFSGSQNPSGDFDLSSFCE